MLGRNVESDPGQQRRVVAQPVLADQPEPFESRARALVRSEHIVVVLPVIHARVAVDVPPEPTAPCDGVDERVVVLDLPGVVARSQRLSHEVEQFGSQQEAASRGSAAVEAEHILLALAAMPDSRGGAFLIANGLDRAALETALLAERRHSLATIGAPEFPETELRAARRRVKPRWGASSREALERGMRMARSREHVSTINLVVGTLIAELGTVPRMLSLAGVDRHLILGRATAESAKGNSR